MKFLRLIVAWLGVACLPVHFASAQVGADPLSHPGRNQPASVIPSEVQWGAVAAVGPGDTLYLTVFGHPELAAQVTVDVDGQIRAPFVGEIAAAGKSPSQIAHEIASGLQGQGYLQQAQVSVEVIRVRSRIASVLGEVNQPGRFALEGQLTLLELLAQAGGLKDDAGDIAVVLRKDPSAENGQRRIERFVGSKQLTDRQVEDMPLQAGDVVFIPQAKKFYIYGEVNQAGSYSMEPGLNVMRALSLAGGLTQRASERRITIQRVEPETGTLGKKRVALDEEVQANDVIFIDERFF